MPDARREMQNARRRGQVILLVLFAAHFSPSAVVGKENIGLRRCVVDFRQAEAVGHSESLLVDTCSTYYIYLFILSAAGQRLLQ